MRNEKLATYCFHFQVRMMLNWFSLSPFRYRLLPPRLCLRSWWYTTTTAAADKRHGPIIRIGNLGYHYAKCSFCLNHNNVQWDVPNFVSETNFILILCHPFPLTGQEAPLLLSTTCSLLRGWFVFIWISPQYRRHPPHELPWSKSTLEITFRLVPIRLHLSESYSDYNGHKTYPRFGN